MKNRIIFILLVIFQMQPALATRGPDDPIRWIFPLMIIVPPILISVLIYIIGRYALKKRGTLKFTFMGSILGFILGAALIAAFYQILGLGAFSTQIVLPFIIIGGCLGYFISHKRNVALRKNRDI